MVEELVEGWRNLNLTVEEEDYIIVDSSLEAQPESKMENWLGGNFN